MLALDERAREATKRISTWPEKRTEMALTDQCPKCKREAEVAFAWDLGQRMIKCVCGNIVPAVGLTFDPEPEFLFKYRPHDSYSESWILNEELFFASPAMFNDPFDSKVMHTFDGTLSQKKRYLSQLLEDRVRGIRKKKKWDIINRALNDGFLERDYESHIARIQKRIDEYGIVSFSRRPDDLLMFAYYAKDHTGYCLKYRRSVGNVLSMAREINYEGWYPKFSIFDFEPTKMGALGDRILFTKANCWKHEDEWRIGFSGVGKRVVKSPQPILVGIILGCNMKPSHRTEIIRLNKRRSNPVAIFEARKKEFEFALDIQAMKT